MTLSTAIKLARDWSKAIINPFKNACVVKILVDDYQVMARPFISDESKIIAEFGPKRLISGR